MWQQNYEPVGGSLGLSAAVAAIPVLVLFFMLGVKRKPAWMAALTALAVAFVIALVAYHMPIKLAVTSTATGAAYAAERDGRPSVRDDLRDHPRVSAHRDGRSRQNARSTAGSDRVRLLVCGRAVVCIELRGAGAHRYSQLAQLHRVHGAGAEAV